MYSYLHQDAFIIRFFLFAVTYTIKYIIHPYTGMLKVFIIIIILLLWYIPHICIKILKISTPGYCQMVWVGFEPTKHYALELKSSPFDRSGIKPQDMLEVGFEPTKPKHSNLSRAPLTARESKRYFILRLFFLKTKNVVWKLWLCCLENYYRSQQGLNLRPHD